MMPHWSVDSERPNRWNEVVGHNHTVQMLMSYCATGNPPPAILLTGPAGLGKRSMAKLVVASATCLARPQGDPDSCGRCRSCSAIQGPVCHITEMTDSWSKFVGDARCASDGNIYLERRGQTTPWVIAGIDGIRPAWQRHLRRVMDGVWRGFLVATTSHPERLDTALRHRFLELPLTPPDVSQMMPWIRGRADGLGIGHGADRDEASRIIAERTGMNFGAILVVLQRMKAAKLSLSVGDASKACGAIAGRSIHSNECPNQ